MSYNPFWLRLGAEVGTQKAVKHRQQQQQPGKRRVLDSSYLQSYTSDSLLCSDWLKATQL